MQHRKSKLTPKDKVPKTSCSVFQNESLTRKTKGRRKWPKTESYKNQKLKDVMIAKIKMMTPNLYVGKGVDNDIMPNV